MSNEALNEYEPEKLTDGTKVYRVPGPKKRGQKLRALRDRAAVNLRELAQLCGIDFSLIGKYENGTVPLSSGRYCELLDGIEKIKREREIEARRQAFVDTFSPVAAELLPIAQALEDAGQESSLTSTEMVHALGMLQLARAHGAYLPPWEPSNLARALGPPNPTYVAIANNLAGKRKQPVDPEHQSKDAERKRQLAALENLGIDAPIISELIESFRREIAEKDELLQSFSRALEKK